MYVKLVLYRNDCDGVTIRNKVILTLMCKLSSFCGIRITTTKNVVKCKFSLFGKDNLVNFYKFNIMYLNILTFLQSNVCG